MPGRSALDPGPEPLFSDDDERQKRSLKPGAHDGVITKNSYCAQARWTQSCCSHAVGSRPKLRGSGAEKAGGDARCCGPLLWHAPCSTNARATTSQRGRAGKVSAARRAWAQFGVQKSRGSGGGVQGELFEVLLVDEVGLHLPLALNLHQPTRLQLDEGSCATCNASSVDQTAKFLVKCKDQPEVDVIFNGARNS
eukprot:451258-Rhodomonas_salina.2